MIIPGFPGLTTVTPDFPTSFVSYSSNGAVGTVSSISVSRPADVESGDLMVAFLMDNIAGSNFNAASGWTKFYDAPGLGNFFMFRRIVTGSEPASYAFPCSSGTEPTRETSILVVAYRGETVVNAWNATAVSTGTAWDAPSITPTLNGTLLAFYGRRVISNLVSGPILMDLKVDQDIGGGVDQTLFMFDKYPQANTATGVKTATFDTVTGGYAALVQIA